jgi:hypothetical protein
LASISKYLYRKAGEAVTLTLTLGALFLPAQAQFRMAPPERKTPRAIGVLETFKNGTRRLVPVTFFYEKKYYDAGLYHATPVPFTLYSETVYEVQQAGKPLGTFTLHSASRHETAWWGNGRFKPLAEPSTLAKKRPAKVHVDDPSKPTLHRREGSEGDNPPPAGASAPAASSSPAEDDPDRPKLHRRESSGEDAKSAQNTAQSSGAGQSTTSQSTSSQTGASQGQDASQQDPDRPRLQRKSDATTTASSGSANPVPASTNGSATAKSTSDDGKTATAGAQGAASQGATSQSAALTQVKTVERTPDRDPDHPVLRRGKPVEEQSGHDLPDSVMGEPVRMVAISDAGPSTETQPLIYACPPEERDRLERQAREMAWSELRSLAAQRGLVLPQKQPAPMAMAKKSAAKTKPQPAAEPEWKPEDEQFVPYDIDYDSYATVVYSARYTPASQPGLPPGAAPRSWVVTIMAREDEDKLVKLYSAVSDPRELDLYPEVRLVDAVDPDGYGHYGFLLREKKRDGVSWLLGRARGYELRTVFETTAR